MTTSSQYQAPETRAAYTEDSIEAAEKEDREIRDLRLMLRPGTTFFFELEIV